MNTVGEVLPRASAPPARYRPGAGSARRGGRPRLAGRPKEPTMRRPLLSLLLSLVLSDSPKSSRRPRQRREACRRFAPRRLHVEALEERTVPSASISIANTTMNEIGAASSFIATGTGGLSSPKDMV